MNGNIKMNNWELKPNGADLEFWYNGSKIKTLQSSTGNFV